MGELDNKFMEDLVKARHLIPKIQGLLNEPGDLPEDLDHPVDQEEVNNVFAFGVVLARLTGQLNKLGVKLCVGMLVQQALDFPEEDEEEEGMTHEEKKRELCIKDSDF